VTLGRIAIIGAGQVGTMLAMALRQAPPSAGITEVALWDRYPGRAPSKPAREAADRVLERIDDALSFDSVVVAIPVREIVRFLEEKGADVRAGALLIDTGSAKRVVVEAMARFVPPSVHAIGGHPVAGTERPGPDGAEPRLLRGAPFVLTPVRDDPQAVLGGRAISEAIGARPVEMDAAIHDRILARTSHLPHLMAAALSQVVAEIGDRHTPQLLGTGWQSAVRLASSDATMVAEFLEANAGEVLAAIGELENALGGLRSALREGPERLAEVLAGARVATETVRASR
jgi:prephenate dehydrogenase